MWFKKKQPAVPENGHGDALVAIAKEDPGALKLVGDIMERNAAENTRVMEDALEMEQRAHKQTMEHLREMRHEVAKTQERIRWLLYGVMPDDLRIQIEQIAEEVAEQVVERERTVVL